MDSGIAADAVNLADGARLMQVKALPVEDSIGSAARMAKDMHMGLNVKLAWLISLGFIGGLTWLITQVSPPTIAVPLPTGSARPAAEKSEPEARPNPRRFEKPSMIEKEAARTLDRSDRLVLADHSAPRGERPVLPPISSLSQRVEADVNAGVASESPGELNAILAARNETRETPADPAFSENAGSEKTAGVTVPDKASSDALPNRSASSAIRTYKVVKGDNLHKVAKKTLDSASRQTVAALLAANPKVAARKNQTIQIGEMLNIPNQPDKPARGSTDESPRLASAAEVANADNNQKSGLVAPEKATVKSAAAKSTNLASKSGKKDSASKPTRVAKSATRTADPKPNATKSKSAGPSSEKAGTARLATASKKEPVATRSNRSDKMRAKDVGDSKSLVRAGAKDAPREKPAAIDPKGKKIAAAGKGAKSARSVGR